MIDREKTMSQDYYEILSDYRYPEGLKHSFEDLVFQRVDTDLGIAYINKNELNLAHYEDLIWYFMAYDIFPNLVQSNLFQPKSILHELVILLAVHRLKRCTKNPRFDLILLFYHLI